MTTDKRQCARCGVEFDGSVFLPGAPCEDCQEWGEEEPATGWLTPRELKRRQAEEFERKTDLIIRQLYDQGYNDKQIADRIGYSSKWTQARRSLMGLPIQENIHKVEFDPIVLDQRYKHVRAIKAYDYDGRTPRAAAERALNASRRLDVGWPEEEEYWKQLDMFEANQRTVRSYFKNARV